MAIDPNHSRLYSRLEHHSISNMSLVIAFLWGMAEGTLFFMVPDVYLTLIALIHWRIGLSATFVTVAGAMVGGAIMYTLAVYDGALMAKVLTLIPLVSMEMLHTVATQMQTYGFGAMVRFPLQAPYKVYAVEAGQQHLPFLTFLLITIPSRLGRILPVTFVGVLLGAVLKKFIQRHTEFVVGVHVLVWVGVHVLAYLWMNRVI